jgi:hypothetical protein
MANVDDRLWKLRCKNEKCGSFFDYFGRMRSDKGIACTNCGQSLQYRVAEFVRHNPANQAAPLPPQHVLDPL